MVGKKGCDMIDCENERQEREAQNRITMMAINLAKLFPPVDAAGLLIGAAVGILETTYGRQKAIEYVAELAREMAGVGDDDEELLN
jgi:hypothetical protein